MNHKIYRMMRVKPRREKDPALEVAVEETNYDAALISTESIQHPKNETEYTIYCYNGLPDGQEIKSNQQ